MKTTLEVSDATLRHAHDQLERDDDGMAPRLRFRNRLVTELVVAYLADLEELERLAIHHLAWHTAVAAHTEVGH